MLGVALNHLSRSCFTYRKITGETQKVAAWLTDIVRGENKQFRISICGREEESVSHLLGGKKCEPPASLFLLRESDRSPFGGQREQH